VIADCSVNNNHIRPADIFTERVPGYSTMPIPEVLIKIPSAAPRATYFGVSGNNFYIGFGSRFTHCFDDGLQGIQTGILLPE